jgi:hypothetical protein
MTTYHQGRFKRVALSQLFNFDMNGNSMTLAGDLATVGDIRVERLDWSTIPGMLGESGFQAFLHPLGAGNCFVVEEAGASDLDDLVRTQAVRRCIRTWKRPLRCRCQEHIVHQPLVLRLLV